MTVSFESQAGEKKSRVLQFYSEKAKIKKIIGGKLFEVAEVGRKWPVGQKIGNLSRQKSSQISCQF